MTKKIFLFLIFFVAPLSISFASSRWILYTSSETVDCSTFTNGGKLTVAGGASYCSDDAGGVSVSSADASYLKQTVAATTYFLISSSSSLLTTSSATATYLQLSSAIATYFPIVSSTTLLTTSSATATYLQLSSATATYLTRSSGTLTYLNNTTTIPNVLIDVSSITKMGNTFNGNSQLVRTDATAAITLAVSTFTTLNTTVIANAGVTTISNTAGGVAIRGVNTNATQSAGFVGEYISSATSNTRVGTSDTFYDLVAVNLSSGAWDITGTIQFRPNGATFSGTNILFEALIGTVAGNNATGGTLGDNYLIDDQIATNFTTGKSQTIQPFRVRINSTTTYYLKGYIGTYTVGNPINSATLRATRVY